MSAVDEKEEDVEAFSISENTMTYWKPFRCICNNFGPFRL